MKWILVAVVSGCLLAIGMTSRAGDELSVDVVPTLSREETAEIFLSKEVRHRFYAVLSNLSDRPQRVYEDWNSWGYDSLSFVVTTATGESVKVTRQPRVWTKNFASTYTIPAGGRYVLPVQWHSNEWCLRTATGESLRTDKLAEVSSGVISLQAVFEIPRPETNTFGVWTGRVESKPMRVKVEKGTE